jgi:hypothetical protein
MKPVSQIALKNNPKVNRSVAAGYIRLVRKTHGNVESKKGADYRLAHPLGAGTALESRHSVR